MMLTVSELLTLDSADVGSREFGHKRVKSTLVIISDGLVMMSASLRDVNNSLALSGSMRCP